MLGFRIFVSLSLCKCRVGVLDGGRFTYDISSRSHSLCLYKVCVLVTFFILCICFSFLVFLCVYKVGLTNEVLSLSERKCITHETSVCVSVRGCFTCEVSLPSVCSISRVLEIRNFILSLNVRV